MASALEHVVWAGGTMARNRPDWPTLEHGYGRWGEASPAPVAEEGSSEKKSRDRGVANDDFRHRAAGRPYGLRGRERKRGGSSGSANVERMPRRVAQSKAQPTTASGDGMVANSENIYSVVENGILRVPTIGGLPVSIASGQPNIMSESVALRERDLYYVVDQKLFRADVNDGPAKVLMEGPNSFTESGGDIFFVDEEDGISRRAADGKITALWSDPKIAASHLKSDADNIYFEGDFPLSVEEDGPSPAGVYKLSKSGGTPTKLAPLAKDAGVMQLAVEGDWVVYFAMSITPMQGGLHAVRKTGGPSPQLWMRLQADWEHARNAWVNVHDVSVASE